MPISKAQTTVNAFNRGLNTDSSVLTVAPNDFMDGTINVEIEESGAVRRRRGVEMLGVSTTGQLFNVLRNPNTDAYQESICGTFVKLTSPSGNIIERLVVDINNTFRIYEGTVLGFINLQSPKQTITRATHSIANQKWAPMSFASSGDKLFFAGKYCKPGYLKVSADNENLEVVYFNVILRDFEVASTADTVRRSGKNYWLECKKEHYSSGTNEAGDGDAVEWGIYWDIMSGAIPSGTPTWTAGIHFKSRANSRVQYAGNWYECLVSHTASTTNRPGTGATWAQYWVTIENPVGEKIIPWESGRTYKGANLSVRYNKATSATASNTYPTAVAFYAGRVWLSGDPKFPNETLFSQTIKYDSDIEKFYQAADPFSVEDNELADDDGGRIQILGAGLCTQMLPVGGFLFIGTTNGIYQVAGSGDSTFKATDFSVNRVLNDSVEGTYNMIATDNELVIFGVNNIWLSQIKSSIATTSTNLAPFISISKDRIQNFYDKVPQINKRMGRAVYNQSERRIYYFFNKARTPFDKQYQLDGAPGYSRNILVLDLDFADEQTPLSFFLYEYADTAHLAKPYIAFPFVAEDVGADGEPVLINGTPVTAAGASVTISTTTKTNNVLYAIALRQNATNIVMGMTKLNGVGVTDWGNTNIYQDTPPFKIIGGVQTGNTITNKKVVPYLSLLMKKIETGALNEDQEEVPTGGALLRVAWNFATSSISNKYSQGYQVYHPNRHSGFSPPSQDGHDHIWYKHRIRGRGVAFQFIIENDEDKDFNLVGYTMDLYGST